MPTAGDTRRISPDVIETTVEERARAAAFEAYLRAWDTLGGAAAWVFDATRCASYEAAVVATASAGLLARRDQGLRLVVASLRSPLVRMASQAVGLSLVARGLPLVIVATRGEALREAARRCAASG